MPNDDNRETDRADRVAEPGVRLRALGDSAEVSALQAEFDNRHPGDAERSSNLEDWLGTVLDMPGKVRHYGTTVSIPSQQLKNKLGQADSMGPDGLVVLFYQRRRQEYRRTPRRHDLARCTFERRSCHKLRSVESGPSLGQILRS